MSTRSPASLNQQRSNQSRRGRRRLQRMESLEPRLCLTVAASLTVGGDLLVEGAPDGLVEIVAGDAGSFRVTDNGVEVALIENVVDDIVVKVDSPESGDLAVDGQDSVRIDLNGQAVDQVFADLGNGDNSLEIVNGTANGLRYRGGDEADAVLVDADVQRSVWVRLGEGDNQFTLRGAVAGLTAVRGGDGVDLVAMTEVSSVGRADLNLGNGDNIVTVGGLIEHGFRLRTGDGADQVAIDESADLAGGCRAAVISLGDGDNTLEVGGIVEQNLLYRGGDNVDSVDLAATSTVDGNVVIDLGAGNNQLAQAGMVSGDLVVRSGNAEDQVTVDETKIGGEVDVQPGVEIPARSHYEMDFGGRHGRGGRLGFAFGFAGLGMRIPHSF